MISKEMEKAWIDGEVAVLTDHLDLEVTEIHGVVCGLIAGGCENDVSSYMQLLSNILHSGEHFEEATKTWLVSFYDQLFQQYQTMETLEFPFEDKITSPEDAAYYFSLWAEAFLIGFGCSHGSEELSESGRELLSEISEFTQVEAEDVESSDELDEILTTLAEHLKVCAMSLYADYGAKTHGRIPVAGENSSPVRDGELVIGDEGISLEELTNLHSTRL